MLTVDLKPLRKQAGSAIRYLGSQLNESLKVKGTQVQIASKRARTVKLLLRKFLHQRGLENHRVVMGPPGMVRVLGPEPKKRRARPEQMNFFQNNETITYYQLAASMGIVPTSARRKWRP